MQDVFLPAKAEAMDGYPAFKDEKNNQNRHKFGNKTAENRKYSHPSSQFQRIHWTKTDLG